MTGSNHHFSPSIGLSDHYQYSLCPAGMEEWSGWVGSQGWLDEYRDSMSSSYPQ